MAAVESDLVDLAGISLDALRSIDGAVLDESVADLLRKIEDPEASVGGYNPPRFG